MPIPCNLIAINPSGILRIIKANKATHKEHKIMTNATTDNQIMDNLLADMGFATTKDTATKRFNEAIKHLNTYHPGQSNYQRHFRAVATSHIIANMPLEEYDAAKEFFTEKNFAARTIAQREYESIFAQDGYKGINELQDAADLFKCKYAALEAVAYADKQIG